MSNNISTLVAKLDDLRSQMDAVKSELATALGLSVTVTAPVAAAPAKRRGRKPGRKKATPTATPTDAATTDTTTTATPTEKKTSMKDVVKEVISRHPDGIALKEIVIEVSNLVKEGKYHTKADNLTPLVSQALHQLKADKVIQAKESAEKSNRSVYTLAA